MRKTRKINWTFQRSMRFWFDISNDNMCWCCCCFCPEVRFENNLFVRNSFNLIEFMLKRSRLSRWFSELTQLHCHDFAPNVQQVKNGEFQLSNWKMKQSFKLAIKLKWHQNNDVNNSIFIRLTNNWLAFWLNHFRLWIICFFLRMSACLSWHQKRRTLNQFISALLIWTMANLSATQ